MKVLETKLVDILKDLKDNYCANSVKAEFAAEGTSFDEIAFLKEIVQRADIALTLKIGGCEAVKDIYDAKNVGVDAVVAPMIETPYALKKFINSINCVYGKEKVKSFINIETVTGVEKFEDIINSKEFNELDGIILGRSDLAASIGLYGDVGSDKILNIAKNISEKMIGLGKEMVIGGGVSVDSLSFFQQIPYLSKIETRKIIFNWVNFINNCDYRVGITKALEFEILWLNNKESFGGRFTDGDKARISLLKSRYKTLELSGSHE